MLIVIKNSLVSVVVQMWSNVSFVIHSSNFNLVKRS
jgi:hypothetical protein